ncbi:hypothetical protein EYZ11_009850 [Aspergillus tanneri]|uniref:Uncharacterized protein n=1 Tax=Aspergillus tanneri TaxID=1220188 RepID=A0A4V3UND3_9EURO|nr:hypothetical protein EYZ11_009850 [Aspergillus tanneri]
MELVVHQSPESDSKNRPPIFDHSHTTGTSTKSKCIHRKMRALDPSIWIKVVLMLESGPSVSREKWFTTTDLRVLGVASAELR